MKLAAADRDIERVSVNNERHFTIKATGKAFRILSGGLYKDKILAIVRELSCNAYDAHVEAGKPDVPFEVHLPNPLEPYFSVRDFGLALSPHQVESVFTTYFESTKTSTNDQIGGLGLGCKSPLSYVDSFTVISRYQGIKRTYTVFFDEADIPSITLMAEENLMPAENGFQVYPVTTTEPDGLEVQLSVRPYDSREFRTRAEQVYRYFPVVPTITGVENFKISNESPILESKDFKLYRNDQDARAIMGVVSYPLDPSSSGCSPAVRRLLEQSIEIEFPIGALDITAGREELSYIPATKECIQERCDQILRDMIKLTLRKFRKCQNEFEARKLYGELIKGTLLGTLFPSAKVPFQDKIINSDYFAINLKDFAPMFIYHYCEDTSKARFTTSQARGVDDIDVFPCTDGLRIIIDDLDGRTTHSRVRQYRFDNDDVDVFVLRCPTDHQKMYSFVALMEGITPILASTLEKMPSKPRYPTSMLVLNKKNQIIKKSDWNRITVDASEGGIYVPTLSGAILKNNEDTINLAEFTQVYNQAISLGLFDPATQPLYSIPRTLMKVINNNSDWEDFFIYVQSAFTDKITNENLGDHMGRRAAVGKFSSKFPTIFSNYDVINSVAGKLPSDHPIREFTKMMSACSTSIDSAELHNFAKRMGIEMPVQQNHDLCAEWSKSGLKYRLLLTVLRISSYDRSQTYADDIAHYINAVDLAEKANDIALVKIDAV